MTKQKMINDILKTIDYELNDWYVGGHEMVGLCRALNIDYVDGDIRKEIHDKSINQIKNGWLYLKRSIAYVKENPIEKCPCCGTIVRKGTVKTN